MSSHPGLVCSGAPRDLGLDQGLHFREVIRAEVERRPRGKRRLRLLGRLVGRDLEAARSARSTARFYPHMAERAEGLARGARMKKAEVAAVPASECRGERETLIGVTSKSDGPKALIAFSAEREAPLFLRHSQPENGYRSLEIAIPWRVPALAGVNEHGLAVAASGVSSSASLSTCTAAPALLVQDCLQRFDGTDKAIEWCERRPAWGSASILLADADGILARVDLQGELRRVHRGSDGTALCAGEPARVASVEEACRASQHLDAEALRRILAARASRVVVLNPEEPEQIFGDLP
jgi:hypothetical protein